MTLLALMKYCSIALTGLFAFLGLVVEFKDEHKNPTGWGIVALVGIIISTATAIFSQTLEQHQTEARALAELQRNSELLSDIARSLQPLRSVTRNLRHTYKVGIDAEDPEF